MAKKTLRQIAIRFIGDSSRFLEFHCSRFLPIQRSSGFVHASLSPGASFSPFTFYLFLPPFRSRDKAERSMDKRKLSVTYGGTAKTFCLTAAGIVSNLWCPFETSLTSHRFIAATHGELWMIRLMNVRILFSLCSVSFSFFFRSWHDNLSFYILLSFTLATSYCSVYQMQFVMFFFRLLLS